MDPPQGPPPSYGATAPPGGAPPPVQQPYPTPYPQPGQQPYPSAYPQPGQPAPPPPGFPQEPPPKYEDPKDGPYATQQPTGYQTMTGTTTVYTQQPVQHTVLVQRTGYGPNPCTLQCPNCQATVTTAINYQNGGLAWLSAGLICLFGCWLGCCLIPFCIPDLQDVEHRCPNCQRHIGTYTRL